MITLAFSVLVYYFFSQVTQLSGFGGVNNVDLPGLVGDPVQDPAPLYYVTLVVAVAGLRRAALRRRARRSAWRCRACATSRRACARSGFNVTRHRILAFGLAAFVAAIAGVLSVWYNRRISPGSINLAQTIDVLIIAVDRRPLPARGRVGRRARLRAARQLLARVDADDRRRARARSASTRSSGSSSWSSSCSRPAASWASGSEARERLERDEAEPPGRRAGDRRAAAERLSSDERHERRGVSVRQASCWRWAAPRSRWGSSPACGDDDDERLGRRRRLGSEQWRRHDQGRLPVGLRGRVRLVLRADRLRASTRR